MKDCYLLNLDGTGYFSCQVRNCAQNYVFGKKNLLELFVFLVMLAFLVDQVQQLCCPLFNAIWKKWKTKRSLWEKERFQFHGFLIESMEDLYQSILPHKQIPLTQ